MPTLQTGPLVPNLIALAFIIGVALLISAFMLRRHGLRVGLRYVPAIMLIAVFVCITHLPWPGPSWEGCGSNRANPLLEPFRFVDAIERRLARDFSLSNWLIKLTVSAPALNLHACIVIGAALALCVQRWRMGVLIGVIMTCAMETSQLTGVFGIFSCPWRQFEVDDLILNTSGVAIGFAIARFLGIRPDMAHKRPQ